MCRDSKCYSYKSAYYGIKKTFDYSKEIDNIDCNSFGYKLRKLRESKKVTKKSLESFVGVKTKMLTAYEKGEYYPKLETVHLIASTFDVEPESLYDDVLKYQINIKDEIQILRESMSFEEIAAAVDSNHRTVRDWHTGKHLPNINITKKLLNLKKEHS